jgi:hypothetical protein
MRNDKFPLWQVQEMGDDEDYPVFTGTEAECEDYCKRRGLKFTRWISHHILMV